MPITEEEVRLMIEQQLGACCHYLFIYKQPLWLSTRKVSRHLSEQVWNTTIIALQKAAYHEATINLGPFLSFEYEYETSNIRVVLDKNYVKYSTQIQLFSIGTINARELVIQELNVFIKKWIKTQKSKIETAQFPDLAKSTLKILHDRLCNLIVNNYSVTIKDVGVIKRNTEDEIIFESIEPQFKQCIGLERRRNV